MHIISKDFRKGKAKLRITDPDDLWYLQSIIEPGDLVKGKATRKVKIGDSENAKVTKKIFNLTIEAETIEFSATGHALRINGKIKEGPEDIPNDSYQSISLEEKSEFSLIKPSWLSYQKQKLTEASEKKYNYLILLLDREEAIFALTKKFGYTILVKTKGDVPKKSKETTINKDFHQELLKALEVYNDRHSPEAIVLASPAFYKDDLFKKINDTKLKSKIVLAIASSVDESALDEVLKRPELAVTLKNSRAREEQLYIEELLTAIKKEGPAAYGEKEVLKASQAGAISSLLITDDFIKKKRELQLFQPIEELMKHIDSLQGKVHLISSEHDGGKKLNGIGGIAALLRYKL